eukprot:1158664-Pelagomonas_calceolata.AAC.12
MSIGIGRERWLGQMQVDIGRGLGLYRCAMALGGSVGTGRCKLTSGGSVGMATEYCYGEGWHRGRADACRQRECWQGGCQHGHIRVGIGREY